jgi:hypothetical protein
MRLFRILMAVMVLACALPLLSRIAAGTVARLYGCTLDPESPRPCLAAGEDIGQSLFALGKLGSLLFATLPVLLSLVLAWILTELAYRHVTRRL